MNEISTEISRDITRRSASNLAFAFFLLPRDRREGMAALYAFCREIDDIADEEDQPIETRRRLLSIWREDIAKACHSGSCELPVIRELVPVIRRFNLPLHLFEEIISGVEMDLEVNRYETSSDLDAYCYKVASAVGLLSIEIFGYQHASARDYAVALGKALQITNILRDVSNDAERGRIYIPIQEMKRYHVEESEILEGVFSERYCKLASNFGERATGYYRQARSLLNEVDRKSMIAAECMGAIYWCLLQKLEDERFNVFKPRRIQVSKSRKLSLALRTWIRNRYFPSMPCYGP